MEDSNVSSAVQLNDSNSTNIESKDAHKPTKALSSNQPLTNGQHFHPSKTMHVMTPGPKQYSNFKKSPDKDLKFVPYEPYKAAVRSIVPELSQPSVAIFKRRLSSASNCSKLSNKVEDKEDVITMLTQEKQVIMMIMF